MSDLSKLILNGSTYNLKDSEARTSIVNLSNSVLHKEENDPNKPGTYTIYISSTGSDLNGDGTYNNPLFSINAAIRHFHQNYSPVFNYANDNQGTFILYIKCLAGEYEFSDSQYINTFYSPSSGFKIVIEPVSYTYSYFDNTDSSNVEFDTINFDVIFKFSPINKDSINYITILSNCEINGIKIIGNKSYRNTCAISTAPQSSCTLRDIEITDCHMGIENKSENLFISGNFYRFSGNSDYANDEKNFGMAITSGTVVIYAKTVQLDYFHDGFNGTYNGNSRLHLFCKKFICTNWLGGVIFSGYLSVNAWIKESNEDTRYIYISPHTTYANSQGEKIGAIFQSADAESVLSRMKNSQLFSDNWMFSLRRIGSAPNENPFFDITPMIMRKSIKLIGETDDNPVGGIPGIYGDYDEVVPNIGYKVYVYMEWSEIPLDNSAYKVEFEHKKDPNAGQVSSNIVHVTRKVFAKKTDQRIYHYGAEKVNKNELFTRFIDFRFEYKSNKETGTSYLGLGNTYNSETDTSSTYNALEKSVLNNKTLLQNSEDLMIICTPDAYSDESFIPKIRIIAKTADGFLVQANCSFNWFAVNLIHSKSFEWANN